MNNTTAKLGLDIGRVLISPDPFAGSAGDTSFLRGTVEDALRTPPYEGMFDAVPALVERFGGRVWLVSKARPRMQEKTRLWLERHAFFERTGIAPDHLRFCFERHEKAGHCRELGLTHFLDDRLDVLGHLEGIVPRRFLFGPQEPGTLIPQSIVYVVDWKAALDRIGIADPALAGTG
jgi:hypothetical protein